LTAPLRLAIVGCGWIAGYVAFFTRLNRRIRLKACCNRSLPDAERFAARHRIPRPTPTIRPCWSGNRWTLSTSDGAVHTEAHTTMGIRRVAQEALFRGSHAR
jgi:hypothetical protein